MTQLSAQTATLPTRRDARSAPPRRRASKDVVLGIAALLGVLAVLWAILAASMGLSVIIFRTGSMSPTIPTGGAAIVRSIPSSQIRVGDIVTVNRGASQIPITHRVVSVSRVSGDAASRSIVLKGDANKSTDPAPYVVKAVGRVEWSAPVLGTVLAIARTPLFIAAITVLVAALVFWAFWPDRRRARPAEPAAGSEQHTLAPLFYRENHEN